MLWQILIDSVFSILSIILLPLNLIAIPLEFSHIVSQAIYHIRIPLQAGADFFTWLFGSNVWSFPIALSILLFPVEQAIKLGWFVYSIIPVFGRKSS